MVNKKTLHKKHWSKPAVQIEDEIWERLETVSQRFVGYPLTEAVRLMIEMDVKFVLSDYFKEWVIHNHIEVNVNQKPDGSVILSVNSTYTEEET
jgi:hypothetical protein